MRFFLLLWVPLSFEFVVIFYDAIQTKMMQSTRGNILYRKNTDITLHEWY